MSVATLSEVDEQLDTQSGKLSHIVLEGFKYKEDGSFISATDLGLPGGSVVESLVFGTEVTALCGEKIVAAELRQKYPLCGKCASIAKENGWSIPT